MKCPVCGCQTFYVKDPEDEYETYSFECRGDEIAFDIAADADSRPQVKDETETFCERCAWHGKFREIKTG